MKITFLHSGNTNFSPIPASNNLPLWYESINSYMGNRKQTINVNGEILTTATVKKCMPVFDVMTAGYLIVTWSDIKISIVNGTPVYEITEKILTNHNLEQATNHPSIFKEDDLIAKFINQWGIQTELGYSCLFIPPTHRENILSILPGIVDTDTYHLPIHLPLVLSDRNFEGVIPAGTPIAQVIPFKREKTQANYQQMLQSDKDKLFDMLHKQPFNGYKTNFWSSKNFL